MSTLELRAYEILKLKLEEKEAETVLEYFDSKTEAKYREKKDVLATKEDILNLRNDLSEKINTSKTDTIKWIFAFFISIALMIVGLYLK